METKLVNKLGAKGFNVTPKTVQLNPDVEFDFAWTSYCIVKDLAGTVSKADKGLTLPEFFIKNYRRHFKNAKTMVDDVSKYISTMALHSLGKEIGLYRYMFTNEVDQKTCRVFIDFFNQVQETQPKLYQNRLKILKNIKLELKKALELGSIILRTDNAVTAFTHILSTHMENTKSSFNHVTAEVVAMLLVEAFILTNNLRDKEDKEGGVFLNWDEFDGQTFTIEANPEREELDEQQYDIEERMEETGQSIERLNAEYRKAMKHKNHISSKAITEPSTSDQMIRICHKYVFEQPEEFIEEPEESEIDAQILELNAKLAKQKAEFELQENMWKLVLNSSKGAVKGYRELKGEIQNVEGLNDALMNLLDRNTDEWRHCFVIKNNTVDKLKRYKLLVAAVLESCSADLKKDLNDFRFAHDEDSKHMRSIFDKKQEFDLHEYLNSVHQRGKPHVHISRLNDTITSKPPKVVHEDNKKRINSLAGKLERFEISREAFNRDTSPELAHIEEDFLNHPFNEEMIEKQEGFDVSDSFIRNEETEKRHKVQAMKESLARVKVQMQPGNESASDKNVTDHSHNTEKLNLEEASKDIKSKAKPRAQVNAKAKSARQHVNNNSHRTGKPEYDETFWSKLISCAPSERTRNGQKQKWE